MINSTPIRVGNKIIGQVEGDTFIKRVRASIHFLRTPRAICLDLESLIQAEGVGARRVQVVDTESGISYRASIEHIRRAGFEIDRGFGKQIGLCMNGWVAQGNGLTQQLHLWGEHETSKTC